MKKPKYRSKRFRWRSEFMVCGINSTDSAAIILRIAQALRHTQCLPADVPANLIIPTNQFQIRERMRSRFYQLDKMNYIEQSFIRKVCSPLSEADNEAKD